MKIAKTYNKYIEDTLKDEKDFCAVVDTEEIRKQDYILYVGIEEQEDNGEPFEEKWKDSQISYQSFSKNSTTLNRR